MLKKKNMKKKLKYLEREFRLTEIKLQYSKKVIKMFIMKINKHKRKKTFVLINFE